jgi:hypothetical protein
LPAIVDEKPTLYKVVDGELELSLHPAQREAWLAKERIIAMLCGSQVGKTEFSVQWLKKEIDSTFNPTDNNNDYAIVTSTFPLLDRKLQGEFLKIFRDQYDLGTFLEGKRIFQYYNDNRRIFLCSAENADSLEAATFKAVVLDEAGQDSFKRQTWEAVKRRLNVYRGRILICTTLYNWGWLKTEVYDKAMNGDKNIKIIHADSIMNPAFPKESWDEEMKNLPAWKFDMQYRGIYSKPAGMIYDSFDSAVHVKKRSDFPNIPGDFPCYVGMDFGTEHTAAMFYCHDTQTDQWFAYQEYVGEKKSVPDHVENLKKLAGNSHIVEIRGGIKSEQGWRDDFGHYGWHILESKTRDVEQGILKVYAFHKTGKLFVFDDLLGYIDQKQKYSRILDEGNSYLPTDKIKDKEWMHLMDAERGILGGMEAVTKKTSGAQFIRVY